MRRRRFIAVAAGSALAGCSDAASDATHETTARSQATRLRVQSGTDRKYDLSFELLELQSERVVRRRTRTLRPGDAFSLDSEFSPGEDYRFVVRRTGEELLALSVYAYEGYVLTVRPGPTVEIARQIEL